jgi:hypothetical protein
VIWNLLKSAGALRPRSEEEADPASWDKQLARVLRLELLSVACGPLNYLLELHSQDGKPL